jgi:hypothetical protein
MTTPEVAPAAPSRRFTIRRFAPWMIAVVLGPVAFIAVTMAVIGMFIAAFGVLLAGVAAAAAVSSVTHLEVEPETGVLRVRRVRALIGRPSEAYALTAVRSFSADPIDDSDLLALTLHYADRTTRVCDGPPETVVEAARWLEGHHRPARKSSASART